MDQDSLNKTHPDLVKIIANLQEVVSSALPSLLKCEGVTEDMAHREYMTVLLAQLVIKYKSEGLIQSIKNLEEFYLKHRGNQ